VPANSQVIDANGRNRIHEWRGLSAPEKRVCGILLNLCKNHEIERGENFWLVQPNDAGVFDGSEVRDGIFCVHPVQIYLDLKDHPERSTEAADELRKKLLNLSTTA